MVVEQGVLQQDQTPLPQSEALQSAGCVEIFEEHASGGNRARPVLARVLERIGKGDTLVVVRIDRLARSLSHLLEVIERLEARGAFFRSIQDPIDTGSPQGKFTLQVLGAAAEFERAARIAAYLRAHARLQVGDAGAAGQIDLGPGQGRSPEASGCMGGAVPRGSTENLTPQAVFWAPPGSCEAPPGAAERPPQRAAERLCSAHNCWIGLHVPAGAKRFEWADGAPTSYTNWAKGQVIRRHTPPFSPYVAPRLPHMSEINALFSF